MESWGSNARRGGQLEPTGAGDSVISIVGVERIRKAGSGVQRWWIV